jgi:hypothetical protein
MLDLLEQIRHTNSPKFLEVILSFCKVFLITTLSVGYIFALRFLTNKILRYLYV